MVHLGQSILNPVADTCTKLLQTSATRSMSTRFFILLLNMQFDYIMRDCHNVGMKCSVDAMRLITFSRVVDNQICYNQKEAFNLYEVSSFQKFSSLKALSCSVFALQTCLYTQSWKGCRAHDCRRAFAGGSNLAHYRVCKRHVQIHALG